MESLIPVMTCFSELIGQVQFPVVRGKGIFFNFFFVGGGGAGVSG